MERKRGPNKVFTALLTAVGNTAVWTPSAGKKFRLMKYFVQITDNAALAVAGVLEFIFQDNTTNMPLGFSTFLPGAAGTTLGAEVSTPWIDLGNGILSIASNNILNGNLSAALTAGEIRVITIGIEE